MLRSKICETGGCESAVCKTLAQCWRDKMRKLIVLVCVLMIATTAFGIGGIRGQKDESAFTNVAHHNGTAWVYLEWEWQVAGTGASVLVDGDGHTNTTAYQTAGLSSDGAVLLRKLAFSVLCAVFVLTVSQVAFGYDIGGYGIDGQRHSEEFQNWTGSYGQGYPYWSHEGGTPNDPGAAGFEPLQDATGQNISDYPVPFDANEIICRPFSQIGYY